jgi:hypothetical protein
MGMGRRLRRLGRRLLRLLQLLRRLRRLGRRLVDSTANKHQKLKRMVEETTQTHFIFICMASQNEDQEYCDSAFNHKEVLEGEEPDKEYIQKQLQEFKGIIRQKHHFIL